MTNTRRFAFRIAAVALGLLPFAALEAGLALAGVGAASRDPLAGFDRSDPLFQRVGERFEVAPHRRKFFAPDGFAATKPPDGFRVFVLGGSTVQGRPWSLETSFPAFVSIALEAAFPGRELEIVNCGGISYASYRLQAIAAEVLEHEPDLLVLCTGHNEFLEDVEYGLVRDLPAGVTSLLGWIARTRTGQWFLGSTADRGELPTGDVETRLDAPEGLERFTWDPDRHAAVLARFRRSVAHIAAACAAHDVPLVLVDPPANLRDCPPFKSREPTPPPLDTDGRDPLATLQHTARAHATFPHHAATAFAHARSLDRAGRHDEARDAYVAAKDLDLCPLRILEPMRTALAAIAAEHDLRIVDAHGLLETSCRDGIAGAERLADHVHPTIRGHQEIAIALAPHVATAAGVALPDDFTARAEAAFQRHTDSLPPVYFARGRAVLEQLDRWASGRVGAPYRDD